jgi:aspartyl/glutamyl-tRNA(Asn/Gln) amidotransferase C subunit
MDVNHVAQLANLVVTKDEEKRFSAQFIDTLETVGIINQLDTSDTVPTYQITGSKNWSRKDEINTLDVLTQKQALSQASKTLNGYFVVPSVLHDS